MSLGTTSRALSFLRWQTAVYKLRRHRHQLDLREEDRHCAMGTVAEVEGGNSRMVMEVEEDTKALEGEAVEVEAGSTTGEILEAYHPANGDEARHRRRGNLDMGGGEDEKVDAVAEEGDGRLDSGFS